MTTYHLTICKPTASAFRRLPTCHSSREIQLDDEQDFHRAQQLCEDSQNMAGFLKWSFIPIRTDQLSDLLFPTLVHGAFSAKESSSSDPMTENAFAVVALIALIWDAVTLPIRLLTYLPRLCYNHYIPQQKHPLIPYLTEKGLGPEVDKPPQEVSTSENGEPTIHYEEDEGQRVNILLDERTVVPGPIRESVHRIYELYLAKKPRPFSPGYHELNSSKALAPGAFVVPENWGIPDGAPVI